MSTTERPLLEVRNLSVSYRQPHGGRMVAVDNVGFTLRAGAALGIVGESGCGKSSLARALLQLEDHTGEVMLDGRILEQMSGRELRNSRRLMQAVFQDPLASLNPRQRVMQLVAEPLEIHHPELTLKEREDRVRELLKRIGIDRSMEQRYPHELSGGQCQRIAVARAFICEPALVICDEPVSALDMSVRGQILSLLATLQRDLDIAVIFIAHDMSAVRYLCETVMVMLGGEVVEVAPRQTLFESPAHPYTRQLLQAVLPPDPADQPPPIRHPASDEQPEQGCVFANRCPHVEPACRKALPAMRNIGASRVACRRAGDI